MSTPLLHVKTAHSLYVFDHAAGTVTRTSHHEDASDLSKYGLQGEPKAYLEAAVVGDRLIVTYLDGTYSTSTTVESVEHVGPVTV